MLLCNSLYFIHLSDYNCKSVSETTGQWDLVGRSFLFLVLFLRFI